MQYQLKRLTMIAAALIASLAALGGAKAVAQECMIGEIKMFAGNFAPRSYALANGQLLPISQNTALFSILGTTYGGDGRTSFGLPDLRGRVSISAGNGPGLSNYKLGRKGGRQETILEERLLGLFRDFVTQRQRRARSADVHVVDAREPVALNRSIP